MYFRWIVVGVVGFGALGLACGSTGKPGAGAGGSGTSAAGSESSSGKGGAADGGKSGGGASGGGDVGGAATGDGEYDASCQSRSSNHIAGTRVGLRNVVSAEGDLAFKGYYDLKTGEDCEFTQDADGVTRCFPLSSSGDSPFYLDSACTEGVQYQGICGRDHIAVPVTADPCDARRRLFALGEPLPVSAVYEKNATGACQPYSTSLNNLYRRGPELNAADYPALKAATWRGKGRISTEGFEGDGGFHAVRGYRDEQLQQACGFRPLRDGQEHCTPISLGGLQLTDAACTATLLSANSDLCGRAAPTFASALSADRCLPGSVYVKAGAAYTEPPYSRDSCALAPPEVVAGAQVFSTSPVPDSDFIGVQDTINEADPGRLKPVYRTSADGGCWFRDFWDTELQTVCSFDLATDNQYYCMPVRPDNGGQLVDAYTDAACTTAATYLRLEACDGVKPPAFVTTSPQQACGGSLSEVHPVNPAPLNADALPMLWSSSGAGCTPLPPFTTQVYFEVGAVLPFSQFVSGTLGK